MRSASARDGTLRLHAARPKRRPRDCTGSWILRTRAPARPRPCSLRALPLLGRAASASQVEGMVGDRRSGGRRARRDQPARFRRGDRLDPAEDALPLAEARPAQQGLGYGPAGNDGHRPTTRSPPPQAENLFFFKIGGPADRGSFGDFFDLRAVGRTVAHVEHLRVHCPASRSSAGNRANLQFGRHPNGLVVK